MPPRLRRYRSLMLPFFSMGAQEIGLEREDVAEWFPARERASECRLNRAPLSFNRRAVDHRRDHRYFGHWSTSYHRRLGIYLAVAVCSYHKPKRTNGHTRRAD